MAEGCRGNTEGVGWKRKKQTATKKDTEWPDCGAPWEVIIVDSQKLQVHGLVALKREQSLESRYHYPDFESQGLFLR